MSICGQLRPMTLAAVYTVHPFPAPPLHAPACRLHPPDLPGTSSAAIAISGMLQLPDPTTIKTLKECLAGPEPGASAVAKAVTAVRESMRAQWRGTLACLIGDGATARA